jgi:hypothetical protein
MDQKPQKKPTLNAAQVIDLIICVLGAGLIVGAIMAFLLG